VVVTTRASLGMAAIAAVPLTTNQGFKSIIPNRNTDSLFAYYRIQTLKPEMVRLASGTTFLEISKADFSRIRTRRPKPDEQSRIAAVLDTADEAIAKTEAVIAKLRQVRAGIVDELLTKANHRADRAPLSSVAFPRFSSVDKLTLPSEEPVRLCNYLDVYQNDYVTAEMEFMHATATPDEIAQFRLQVGDVLITKDSESPDDIGIPCVIDSTAPDLLCGYHLALIRPNQPRIDPTYLAMQLAHNRLAAYFGQQAVGSTRYGLSVAAIANAPILLPRIDEQHEAGKLIRLQDAQISQHEAELRKLTSIKSGLVTDLLSGRVRVPETIGTTS
jgi:type I restriction enzyme S subunit